MKKKTKQQWIPDFTELTPLLHDVIQYFRGIRVKYETLQ